MSESPRKITVRPSGPYLVRGGIPLVVKSQEMSEHGEPLSWQDGEEISSEETYLLCRCGKSESKPFCDGNHTMVEFDGKESADTEPLAARTKIFTSPKIFIHDEHSVCVHSGFCKDRISDIWAMREESGDAEVLAKIIDKIDNCPSGALAYALGADGEIIEPDLQEEIVAIPDGPLWVTGEITIERRDGQPLEIRNRMTLCRCGASSKKPLCDGTHKEIGFTDQS